VKIEGLVGRTMRALPSGSKATMALAARAGFLRPSRGGWMVLPLGLRVLSRISEALLKGLDCQPVGVLAPDAESSAGAISELFRNETQSYRHLPLRIATTRREGASDPLAEAPTDGRPWLGMAGVFGSAEALGEFLAHADANLREVAASAGVEIETAKGLDGACALMAFDANGRDLAVGCSKCRQSYLSEAAPFAREEMGMGAPGPMERVHTPGASTIQALAEMLGVERRQTLKALFLASEKHELVFAVLRGDLEASMAKLARVTGAVRLRAATDAEIIDGGAFPGFASPVGLKVRAAGAREGVRVVADLSVYSGFDFVAGANAEDYHLRHVDPRRDFAVTDVADIALAPASARCATCGGPLTEKPGTVIARSSPLEPPPFADEAGVEMAGSAAWTCVDLITLFEQLVRACADDGGIAWPVALAPADIHVISLKEDDACLSTVRHLEGQGLTVLYDDRPIGAGAKFTDADLIGCPLRATVSSRSLQAGGAELAGRRGISPEVVSVAQLPVRAKARLASLMSS
jgi:prolyl-tRNA synthetase